MGKGKRVKDEAESETEVVDGIFHVGLHKGYHGVKNRKFVAIDEILSKELEKVVGEPDAFDEDSHREHEENPEATLKKALSRNMTWEAIEKEFMQSEFWKRASDPKTSVKKFDAHDSSVAKLRLANFWRSKKEILDKQLEESEKFIPKAKSWFDEFVSDPDISDYLELDMRKVWDEIASVGVAVEGPNGESIGRDTRDRHGILEKSFLDIGIVRLPDFEKPHVKVFRLKLTVWSQVSKKLIVGSGIRGDLRTCKYCPRDEHMSTIQEALKRAKGNTSALKFMTAHADK
ncbi:hypothetical protein FA13DRAFT_1732538 [Coprinellus micaceus]|uniref:Uncharacterized protein n=1 Tax=Coprinellus micaceus TaxID=71717 RepID=A0A4Y7TBW5_COPMI|nr:hypothetical protein FA13DRAFT_1732538 [Coprinellus micaceus]